MSTFKVMYHRPARPRVKVIEALTPEQAAAAVRDEHKGEVESVVVQAVADEDERRRHVYQWCGVCGLPIWMDDDITTYRTYANDDNSDAAIVHVSCLTGKKKKP